MTRLLNWLNGWQRDRDGWLVRAIRDSDPDDLPAEIGFTEEACIAVRDHRQARLLDLSAAPGEAGE